MEPKGNLPLNYVGKNTGLLSVKPNIALPLFKHLNGEHT